MLLFMRSLQIPLHTFSLSPNDLHLLLNMFLKKTKKKQDSFSGKLCEITRWWLCSCTQQQQRVKCTQRSFPFFYESYWLCNTHFKTRLSVCSIDTLDIDLVTPDNCYWHLINILAVCVALKNWNDASRVRLSIYTLLFGWVERFCVSWPKHCRTWLLTCVSTLNISPNLTLSSGQ